MLGLHLYTPKIGHKSCNMLSILNILTLQKELQKYVPTKCVLKQKVKTKIKTLAGPGIELDTSRTRIGYITSAPPNQRRVLIVFKLLTVSTQWVKTQINRAEFAGQPFSTNSLFL